MPSCKVSAIASKTRVGLQASACAVTALDGGIVVIAPWAWYRVASGLVDHWRVACGYTVYEWYVSDAWRQSYAASSSAEYYREEIKQAIAQFAAQGAKYVLLIGDYNFWREDAWHGEQRDHDILPTYTFPHSDSGTLWSLPFYSSDYPYGDVDDDGLPDLAVGRIPVIDEYALYDYIQKVIEYDEDALASEAGVRIVGYSYDDPAAPRAAQIANCATDSLAILSAGIGTSHWFRYGWETARSPGSAIDMCAQLWGQEMPSLVVAHGVWSQRYAPVHLLSMDMLNRVGDTGSAVVIAGSCSSGNYALTEYPLGRRPVCEEALLGAGRAVMWVGPTESSMEWGDYLVIKHVLGEVSADPGIAMGEAVRRGVRRVMSDFPNHAPVRDTALSFQTLGSPVTLLRNHWNGVTGVSTGAEATLDVRTWPNPCAGQLHISVVQKVAGNVAISVYDIKGRLLRRWVHDAKLKGEGCFWDVSDQRGRRVASGVYVLKVEDASGVKALRRVVVAR
jgi:hypothetical protein